jgi:hypothetical protein
VRRLIRDGYLLASVLEEGGEASARLDPVVFQVRHKSILRLSLRSPDLLKQALLLAPVDPATELDSARNLIIAERVPAKG